MAISHQFRKAKPAEPLKADEPFVAALAEARIVTVTEVSAEIAGPEKTSDGFAAFVKANGVRGAAAALDISQGSVVKYCRGGAPRLVRLAVWALERGAEV